MQTFMSSTPTQDEAPNYGNNQEDVNMNEDFALNQKSYFNLYDRYIKDFSNFKSKLAPIIKHLHVSLASNNNPNPTSKEEKI